MLLFTFSFFVHVLKKYWKYVLFLMFFYHFCVINYTKTGCNHSKMPK